MSAKLGLAASKGRKLQYFHIAHCTFAVSDGDKLLLIDPFFTGRFYWAGNTERHLDRPSLKLSAIRHCDAVLVSHEHGDHYDPDALRTLLKQTKAIIYAPRIVIDDAVKRGLDRRRFRELRPLHSFRVGRMKITPFPSAGSEKIRPIDRFGFLIEAGGRRFYHQGDSHSYSPTWLKFRDKLDVLVMWPHRVTEVVSVIRPRTVVLHHLDRFRPGNFHCNRDAKLELRYWRHYHPTIRFVVPKRNTWYAV
jgi:L-ascorbate metabolism protein UlaG (beta-lactamase superfamily)